MSSSPAHARCRPHEAAVARSPEKRRCKTIKTIRSENMLPRLEPRCQRGILFFLRNKARNRIKSSGPCQGPPAERPVFGTSEVFARQALPGFPAPAPRPAPPSRTAGREPYMRGAYSFLSTSSAKALTASGSLEASPSIFRPSQMICAPSPLAFSSMAGTAPQ